MESKRPSSNGNGSTATKVAFAFLGVLAGVMVTTVVDAMTDAENARRIQLNTQAIQSLQTQVIDRLARLETKLESVQETLRVR